MEDTVRALLAGLATLPIVVFPDWDAVATDKSISFCLLHCDAIVAGFGAVLKQKQRDGWIRPIIYTRRVTLGNEQN